jgi:hypothetical protein
MLHFSTKSIVTLLLIGSITVAAIAQNRDKKEPPPRPTNLQVLPRNIDHDSLIATMRMFSASLGVKCGFCHVASKEPGGHLDFASDDNRHKEIARDMMEMTAQINKKYFRPRRRDRDDDRAEARATTSLRVTCYTCHNGHEEPQAFVPMREEKR